jgi:hypothetical protein
MPERRQRDYDDSYPTCLRTYSTLRIFSDQLEPEEITRTIGIEATESFQKGDVHGQGKLRRKANGWFYSTKKECSSRDGRRHIDLLLDLLEGKDGAVVDLRSKGCALDITSFWDSTGQGGPWLMPDQMLKLGSLGLEVWWDIYFSDEKET